MTYEVEMKFAVSDLATVERKLAALGATIGENTQQVDTYFNHPARDFAATDEALRIRRQGDAWRLTYKGPKLDATAKTRREIELPLTSDGCQAEQWREVLLALGFRVVADVKKTRRTMHIPFAGRAIEAALDEVEGLGSFVELELIADEDDLEAAQAVIAKLAGELGLEQPERRSYLEMLLEESH
jgi:adenylate cyclase class 2